MGNYQINEKLSELNSGNYQVKVTNIGDKRKNKYCSFEYFVTVKYQIINKFTPTLTKGVIAGTWGTPIDIELNKDIELSNPIFWDWQDFNDELFEKVLRVQKDINQREINTNVKGANNA